MAKVRANIVVIGDTPEAQRIRTILSELGATLIDPSEAYRFDSYAAVLLTEKPLTRTARGGKLPNRRHCQIRRTLDELTEIGVEHVPTCVRSANGFVVFSVEKVRSPWHPRNLEDAVREMERVCTRLRNMAMNTAFHDAAKRKKQRQLRAPAMA